MHQSSLLLSAKKKLLISFILVAFRDLYSSQIRTSRDIQTHTTSNNLRHGTRIKKPNMYTKAKTTEQRYTAETTDGMHFNNPKMIFN